LWAARTRKSHEWCAVEALGGSDACDVDGEEVDAVAVEVATGAVECSVVRGSACRVRI